jgi:DUF1365 family protein
MNSALYVGEVVHHRYQPVGHSLKYRLFWMLIDLDELPVLPSLVFSHNKRNVVSFHDRDHLDGSDTPLRMQVEALLRQAGMEADGGAIRVLCMPRVLGRAFNPISVYFCHRRDGALMAMLYEVHNTFGQRHSYLIPVTDPDARVIRQHCDKRFYVSPFMGMDMTYDFRIVPPGAETAVIVDGGDARGKVISASFTGRRHALTAPALLGLALRHGFLALRVLGAIHWEALKLWRKGLGLQPRPASPVDAVTIVVPPKG